MSGGPFSFTDTKPYQDDPVCVLDGVPLNVRSQIDKDPGPGANLIEMVDHSDVVQIDWRDADLPELVDKYTFKTPQRAVSEAAWWKVKQARALCRPLVLVDFDYEWVAFSAGPQLETFTLPRPTAKAFYSGFPSTYPIVAKLNGGALEVIESGTPSSGQIKVVGSVVSTAGLTNGDLLEIGYVAAYFVALVSMPQQYRGGNDLTREVTFSEVRNWSNNWRTPTPPAE